MNTERMCVRAMCEGDRREYARIMAISAALHGPWSPSLPAGESHEALFDRQMVKMAAGSAWKGVGVLADGRIAGLFNLNELLRGPFQNAYAGWSINAEVAGQGYAT